MKNKETYPLGVALIALAVGSFILIGAFWGDMRTGDPLPPPSLRPEPATRTEIVSPADPFVPQHLRRTDGERWWSVWYGDASWYDYTVDEGERWGRVCNRILEDCLTEHTFVAASRDFDRGTLLFVTNMANRKSVVVTVTDYGPDASLHPERVIDLGSKAFAQIADLGEGIIPVKVEEILR